MGSNSFVKPPSERGHNVSEKTQGHSSVFHPVVLSDPALSLLTPDITGEHLLWRYVPVGSSAVLIWDILSNLKADYMLLFKCRLAWPVAAYFVSRTTCAAYVIGNAVFLTYPVGICHAFNLALGVIYTVAIPSTSLLFFFRVRAIYGCTRAATVVFGLLWIAVLATSTIGPIATRGVNIGPTRYCITGEVVDYAGAIGLAPGMFDTAVVLAISYKLIRNAHVEHPSWKQKARAFFTGAYLPSFSRSLIVDGQIYYLITAISNVVTFILPCLPGLAIPYRSLLVVTNVTLTNVMACRVYRHTRLDLAQQSFMFPTTHRGDLTRNIAVELTTQSRSLHFAGPRWEMRTKDSDAGTSPL
ncbi:hypothetical protein K438DRAFT_1725414 [Mycena galopus ATCC 62051]|nr:hypothetical protein K438DRAFT_1725414 [Mycena galopus ATCC 62051]